MIKYDYTQDILTIDGKVVELKPFRKWLLANHEQLCSGHFVKAIKVGHKIKFTYDWQSIYLKAEEYQFLNQYINEVNP